MVRNGCQKCGQSDVANLRDGGLFVFFMHDVRCWSVRTAINNLLWLWRRKRQHAWPFGPLESA